MEQMPTGTNDLDEVVGGGPPGGLREQAAERLESAADALHEHAEGYEGRLGGYGRQAAGWLDRSAQYLRSADAQKMRTDVEDQVRRNPGRALLVAGAAGLMLGVLLRRR